MLVGGGGTGDATELAAAGEALAANHAANNVLDANRPRRRLHGAPVRVIVSNPVGCKKRLGLRFGEALELARWLNQFRAQVSRGTRAGR